MIFKFALRNLIRFPWRTLLYGFVIFFIIMAMTASFFVWSACEDAADALDENYMFIASLVKRESAGIPLSEVFKCLDYEKIEAFNVTMSEGQGMLPSGPSLKTPMSIEVGGVADKVLFEDDACALYGVENLTLVYPFFSGECTVREGRDFTRKGYVGEKAEIVIPWHVSELYGIEVGDIVYRRYFRQVGESGFVYFPATVVGIYETSTQNPDIQKYPAYIPLALAELDYGELYSINHTTVADYTIERADFVLAERTDFENFVLYANENGLDFQSGNIVFNNSTYDVLASELDNVHMIALLVLVIVFIVGLGIFIFFTLYLCNSRAKEVVLLSSLGMKKMHIRAMIALELCLVILFSTLLGLGLGYLAASKVCGFVNDTVLARASVSEEIQNLNSASDFEITMPLEKNMKIQIFTDDTRISENTVVLHTMNALEDNEIGVSVQNLYIYQTWEEFQEYANLSRTESEETMAAMYQAMIERERVPVRVIGVSDLSYFKLTETQNDLSEETIQLYVSEDSPYLTAGGIDLQRFNVGDMIINVTDGMGAKIQTATHLDSHFFTIAGTYKANDYISGNDILVSIGDYHKIFAEFSIMDEEYCFKRIGEIYSKEAE